MHWAAGLGGFVLVLALLSGSTIDTSVAWLDDRVQEAIEEQIIWRADSPPDVQGRRVLGRQ